MTQLIIYNQDNGIPAVVMPTEEALQQHGIMAIAIKDVPAGKRFKIVDASELPTDVPQEAWVVDDAELTDGVALGASRWFIKEWQAEIAKIESEQAPTPEQPAPREQLNTLNGADQMTAEQLDAVYEQYLADLQQKNANALTAWESSKTQRIAQLNAQIAAMEQEISEVGA